MPPYEPIPEEEQSPVTRSMMPALPEGEETLARLREMRHIKVFGLLLVSDSHKAAAQLVRERWSELHHLSGPHFVLVAFQPPAALSDSLRAHWQLQLGADFDDTWARWQRPLDAGTAYSYLTLFKTPKLTPSDLPCLVLFTDPEERKAVVRPLPDWDVDALFKLFVGICERVQACAELPAEERLDALRDELTSPGARTKARLSHLSAQALNYLKEHPAKVGATAIGFILALATGGVLPLAASAVAVLSAVKGALKGEPAK